MPFQKHDKMDSDKTSLKEEKFSPPNVHLKTKTIVYGPTSTSV
jgi:hypothetical protein